MIDPEDFGPLDAALRRIKAADQSNKRLKDVANQMIRAMGQYRKKCGAAVTRRGKNGARPSASI